MVAIIPSTLFSAKINTIASQWSFDIRPSNDGDQFILEVIDQRLQLRKCDELTMGAVYVDFLSDQAKYRRKLGGGKSQAVVKACGLKKQPYPTILDVTAGLGRDAFVLASIGARVHMIERNPVVAALLEDGLSRAQEDDEIGSWVKERLSLSYQDACTSLEELPFKPDVIYCDPMFEEKNKSALVKKEMRVFQFLIGQDRDADQLFKQAINTASKRVVVKRSAQATYLGGRKPTTQIKTKKNRFDIYLK